MTLLLPDPCDEHCPEEFRQVAIREIERFAAYVTKTVAGAELLVSDLRSDLRGRNRQKKQAARQEANRRQQAWSKAANRTDWTPPQVRDALLQLVASGSSWDFAADETFLKAARNLVGAAHPEETPLVVDPFAGGGSIPLEALRLGCETFASDLNPVACLVLKVMLEDIPRHGPGLADELRKTGAEIKAKAGKELANLYPKDPDGAMPIAYLWARTVRCEAPDCGAEIPLMRSMWLCRKPSRKYALHPNIVRDEGVPPRVEFGIFGTKFDSTVANGTVSRARATCPCCGAVLPPERVRSQLAAQSGGADVVFDDQGNRTGGARMTAVVTLRPGEKGRHYRLPTESDYVAAWSAQQRVARILNAWERGGRQGLRPVPDEPTPSKDSHRAVGSQLHLYNITTFGDLFTARQKLALVKLGGFSVASAFPTKQLLVLAVGRASDQMSSLVRWLETIEAIASTFGRQALAMVWDFCETVPTGSYGANFGAAVEWIAEVIERWQGSERGQVQQANASDHPLPGESAEIWFTDPPYYDAVPYADLSDFFLVWLKRALPGHPVLRDPFDPDNALSPKIHEAIQCEKVKDAYGRPKDRGFYERAMASAFLEGRRVVREEGVGSIVFAHKSTEGWEALLSGIIQGAWTITGSWPIATERQVRPNAYETASLATSVHLICRPRPEDALIGDWADVLRELPKRVADWMQRLQKEGVRGADLVFACVGPALEIYSRYRAVETADGRQVGLPEYLEKVWEVVGREALEQVLGTAEAQARNGAAGALEEDSRLTALFLWTMQSTAETAPSGNGAGTDDDEGEEEGEVPPRKVPVYSLPFDVTRRFAQPLGIHLDDWESRIIKTEKGVVRLLPVTERGKQLFGESGASAVADEMEAASNVNPQLSLFPEEPPTVRGRTRRRQRSASTAIGDTELTLSATTLDRVHAAMLLQASGRSQALRNLLRAEQERSPDFLRLANALTALYPRGSEEKRLLDAMLLAAPR